MQELIGRIVEKVGLAPDTATEAVAIIMNFLKTEAEPDVVARIVEAMPEMDQIAAAAPQPSGGGGLLGILGGLIGGGMGGAMATFTLLTDLGLDMGQVQAVTREVVGFARERAGDEVVDRVIGSIPGLSGFAG